MRDYSAESYAILTRARASSTLVTLLGENASIFEHSKLDLYGNPKSSNRPKLPWLVYLFRGISGASGGIRPLNGSFWAYCDSNLGEQRLLDIAGVLDDLFGAKSRTAILYGDLSIPYVGTILPDASLGGLIGLETRIQYIRRS